MIEHIADNHIQTHHVRGGALKRESSEETYANVLRAGLNFGGNF